MSAVRSRLAPRRKSSDYSESSSRFFHAITTILKHRLSESDQVENWVAEMEACANLIFHVAPAHDLSPTREPAYENSKRGIAGNANAML